jgi:hypothetical protein
VLNNGNKGTVTKADSPLNTIVQWDGTVGNRAYLGGMNTLAFLENGVELFMETL